jgi:hypothetical protein
VVNSGIFAEYFTRNQLAKTHGFPGVRVDRDAGFPCGNEKHIVGVIEVVNN